MTSGKRILKRTIIIFVYLVILSLFVAAIYYIFRTKPTCSDKIKNQGEENVDCGGPCSKCEPIPVIENIRTIRKAVISAGPGKYDALVKVNNPNPQFGIASFDYSFDFVDSSGSVIAKEEGTSFILPAETKDILAFNVQLPDNPSTFEFRIKSFRWQKFSEYEEPNIAVYGREFSFISDGSGFAMLKAKIQNKSGYDFRKITTKAIVKDKNGVPVAVNQTYNNDIKVNEEREITFRWSDPFSQDIDVQDIEVETEVDVFSSDNFMKKFGTLEQYDSYNINGQK
jgi:hypothetical protein